MSRMKRDALNARAINDNSLVESAVAPLRSWSELTRSVDVPTDLAAVLLSGRPELIHCLRPVAMDAEGVGKLYRLLAVLIETNGALQKHAERVSQKAAELQGHLLGFMSSADRLRDFADFRQETADLPEDEAA